MVSPPVRQLRHPARDRLWSVGEQRADLPNVGDSQEPRHCASFGRLGPGRRSRMALLASPDVGVRRRTLLTNRLAGLGGVTLLRLPTGEGNADP